MEKVIIKKPTSEGLEKLGVFSWPTWEREESEFDRSYPKMRFFVS